MEPESEVAVVAAPVLAKFADMKPEMKVRSGERVLVVSEKDDLRVSLYSEADFGKKVSYYGPEFDAREFEVVPVPASKPKR